jgi:hypothetical protein
MRNGPRRHASWQGLLAAPAPASHILQIYDSDDFLAAGVALFAAEGLRRGEAVLLTGTETHLRGIRRELAAKGADPDAAIARGQLALADVHQQVEAILRDGLPDEDLAVGGDALASARVDGRFSGLRWWGEISNILHQTGKTRTGLAAEEIGNAVARQHGVTVFCSFLSDRFDPTCYDGVLTDLCCKHSHVIPAEDYVRHRLAVNRAIAEVVGDIKGPLLQSLLSWKGLSCELPSSQVILFWIRDAMPDKFRDVLTRAKAYQFEQRAESPR